VLGVDFIEVISILKYLAPFGFAKGRLAIAACEIFVYN
jgi:hypothetical protein